MHFLTEQRTTTTNVVAYKMTQLKTQSEKRSLQEQMNALSRCKPGWRWDEDSDNQTKTVHIWIRVAEDVTSRDIEFRVAAAPTNQLVLRVKKETVFDCSMHLSACVEGSECEWGIEPDRMRNGTRSIHLSLPRCTHKPCPPYTNCFRGSLPKALLTTKTFGESRPVTIPKKKKRRAPRVTETILSGCEAPTVPVAEVPIDMFYGVPVCDAEGKWSIITGPESSSVSSSLLQAQVPKEVEEVDLSSASEASPTLEESTRISAKEVSSFLLKILFNARAPTRLFRSPSIHFVNWVSRTSLAECNILFLCHTWDLCAASTSQLARFSTWRQADKRLSLVFVPAGKLVWEFKGSTCFAGVRPLSLSLRHRKWRLCKI